MNRNENINCNAPIAASPSVSAQRLGEETRRGRNFIAPMAASPSAGAQRLCEETRRGQVIVNVY